MAMRHHGVLSWLLFPALLGCATAAGDNVVKLTKFNFESNVRQGSWFVKFYAPWCTHCQRLAPVWEKLADQAAAGEWPVKVAEVDCTVSKDICEKVQVKEFPTLALISDGKLKGRYRGKVSSVTHFEEWLNDQQILQTAATAPAVDIVVEENADVKQAVSATHMEAMVAVVKNVLARFPTSSPILNLYFYCGLVLVVMVAVLCAVAGADSGDGAGEHEKEG